MAKSTSEWMTIAVFFIGGGGLIGLLKYIDELKNKEVALIDSQLKRTEQALKRAEEREHDNFEILTEALRGLDEGSLSSQDAARIQKVLSLVHEKKSLVEELNDYKNAASWLTVRKTEWVKTAIKTTVRSFNREIPRNKSKKFKEDIFCYLDWVYQCLYLYGYPAISLQEFVPAPIASSHFPYTETIQLIVDMKDWGTLTNNQIDALEGMFEELMERLPHEFHG